jgi:ATPase family associated with various cellular activities (AAA)
VDPINERIADVEELDRLRQRARKFQQDAIEALTATIYLPQPRNELTPYWTTWKRDAPRDRWRLPGDDIEKGMMLQVLLKHDAKKQGHSESQEASRSRLRQDLLQIRVADCNKTKNANPTESLDNVPIMRCAMVLQALVTDGHGLTPAALACFYRIVLELNEVVGPTWSGGAARASADALASAFITGECALALLAFERAMIRTAEAADLIGQEKKRIAELRSDVPVWREQEEAYRAMALYASLTALLPQLAIKLSQDVLSRVRDLRESRTSPAALNSVVDEVERVLMTALGTIPSAAEILPTIPSESAVSAADPVAKIVSQGLGMAAQNAAQLVLTKLVALLKNDKPEDVVGVARNLRAGAQVLHDLIEPVAHFAESIVDRELAGPQLDLTVDAAELVFATCLLGRLSGWRQPKVRSAFQLARRLLSSNGRLLSFQPFNVQSQGYRINVATFEVTRRLAELAALVEMELEPAFVETLMRPFEDTRAPGHDDTERGWMTDPRGRDPQSEWWVTALAIDALGNVIQMLNAEINRRVLQEFHVRRPAEIDLDLNRLFYPDYGLTALRSNRAGWDRTVAVKLQELRIHAGNGAREETPRYSLVLYGPPGTGKTTLVEAIAKSADVPLVEITPSDILVGGEEAIE